MNLQSFEYYLKDNHLAPRTIEENVKDLIRFEAWAKENNFTDVQRMNYNELLLYVQCMKKQNLSIPTINIRVNSIKKYYDHLKEEGEIERNPVRHLHIKGTMKRITENPLTYMQLETLYTQYAEYSKEKDHSITSLAMLSLMIWQGVHGGELVKMEVKHIKLNSGLVYIPSTRRSNSRELKLDSKQIISLHTYLSTLPTAQEKLFEGSIRNWITRLTNELKGINTIIKNGQHIRASVILHWIKMYGKRQVQYMAGHRYINSTERYEMQEMDSLTDLLTKHHPFS